MMSSTSSCTDGYGNFMMHQPQVSSNFYNQNGNHQRGQQQGSGSLAYPGDWAGAPLIKSTVESRHKKLYPSRSNGYEYDESSMSRLAKHTHGAPIIMSSRYRNKTSKPIQPFGPENGNLRNQNAFAKAPSSDEMQNCDDYHANGTCLPRIIKPRKRRKKDRKPLAGAAMENNPPNPFTFSSNQSNGFMQTNSSSTNNHTVSYQNQMSENFKRPALPNDCNLFFNCDFDSNIVLPLPSSSTSSSPISLSNSSLSSSTTTSSCSCRLCDPNCRIWAFPLRRSFSDNSAVELDHHNNNSSDCVHIETSRKDVGVIGGNRVKSEWNSVGDSTLSILDMIEFNDYKHNQQQSLIADVNVNRLRSESLSDSGDSGCADLLLGRLNISDDILSNTMKTVGDGLTSEGLNGIAKHLSEFSLLTSRPEDAENIFNNEDRLETFQFNSISKSVSSCEFGDRQAVSSSGGNYGTLMSPMLVNKQNFSNNLDLNNNHHGAAPTVDGCGLKERTFFNCFDVTWKGS